MAVPKITDYEIQEKLGAGSYATVYKARHKVSEMSQRSLFWDSQRVHSVLIFACIAEDEHIPRHQVRAEVVAFQVSHG